MPLRHRRAVADAGIDGTALLQTRTFGYFTRERHPETGLRGEWLGD